MPIDDGEARITEGNVGSLHLHRLDGSALDGLRADLHAMQQGKRFICRKPVDPALHADSLDIDHIEPLASGGKDDPANFALTDASCNHSKQASDLRVARVLGRFDAICEAAASDDANLAMCCSIMAARATTCRSHGTMARSG